METKITVDTMERSDWDFFRKGLRLLVDDTGLSDSEFGREAGVHAVTLSKFFNKKTKTMKKTTVRKLLKHLDTDIESIISHGGGTQYYVEPKADREDVSYSQMTTEELKASVDRLSRNLTLEGRARLDTTNATLSALVEERNRVLKEHDILLGYLNNITDAIVVCDFEFRVIYNNLPYVDVEDTWGCSRVCPDWCSDGGSIGLVSEVFRTGRPQSALVRHGDNIFGISVSPIQDAKGVPWQAVSVVRNIHANINDRCNCLQLSYSERQLPDIS